jgi:hypothetical protein
VHAHDLLIHERANDGDHHNGYGCNVFNEVITEPFCQLNQINTAAAVAVAWLRIIHPDTRENVKK